MGKILNNAKETSGNRYKNMGELFDTNNAFWGFVSKLVDAMILGLIWIACCIPIVTIGPATTAVYYVTLKMVRDEDGYIFRSFLKSFRQNFKQALIIWIIYLVFAAFFAFDIYWYYQDPSEVGGILMCMFVLLFVLWFVSAVYMFPMLAKFSNTTANFFRTSTVLPIRHILTTVIVLAEFAVCFYIVFLLPPMIIFMPGVYMFLSSYHFRKIFDIYCEKIMEREGAKEDKSGLDAEDAEDTEDAEDAADETEETNELE